MQPDQIERWIEQNSWKMDLSTQLLGDEPNALRRDWDSSSLRWLIAASWPYLHTAGNQSIPAVCQAITDASPSYLADRWYLPATPRDFRLLEKAGIPVFGVESKHELRDFDIVGTSISYLVLLMNFAKYLTASGMPLRWRDREEHAGEYPMVMIGGQAYSAPAAMEPIADCLWLGEVEDEPGNGGIGQVCHVIEEMKRDGNWAGDRAGCYQQLARQFEYLHFPRFVRTGYAYADRGLPEPSKVVAGYENLLPGQVFPRRARKVRNIDSIAPLRSAPLVYDNPDMGAGDLEVARGCPAWCSFCRLSWVTKPYRQRSVDYTVRHAAEWQLNMGSVELSPFGPDFPMHTERKRLIAELLEKVNDEADSVAMRVDDFIADGDYILLQAIGGMDAVTLGLEGNSQRMRDLVGKGTSDREVEEAVIRGIRAGLRKFKLFMITNLPGEEPADVMRIVNLARRLAQIRDELGQPNVRIQFSWTPLLIEAGTPFQWFAPTAADHTLIQVADQFRELKMDFKVGDLDNREPVLTPDRGLVPIGELKTGDLLVDPEGMPSQVTGVFPRGTNEIYRVSWSDGTSVLATGNHPWDVWCYSGRDWVQKTVTTLRMQKTAGKYLAPRLVRMPGLAQQDLGSDDTLLLDPYLLGLLLGDGCFTKNCPSYASADEELTEAAGALLPAGVQLVYDCTGYGGKVVSWNLSQADQGGNNYPRRVNPVTGELRRLGLWGHRAWEKFVPESYKLTTAKARLAVLQGLMDTDGTVNRGKAVFTSSSEQLRDDVVWLARSLGLVARATQHQSYYTKEDGSRENCRMCYRAAVWWTAETPVFRLARKAAHPVPKSPPRKLVSVEPEGAAPTTCISVSATSERYIATTGFIPTHNTKAEPNKVAFFQLCQRASAEAGEAIVDVLAALDQGCWGGVPRDMRDRLESSLRAHGFANGFADCFDERFQDDLFGWEYIDTGVSRQLMWDTYQQMTEFLEHTDAETYDEGLSEGYHGQEFIARCDRQCMGNSCGVCAPEDLRLRQEYIRAADRDIDLAAVRPVDQSSVACRLRMRIERPEKYRFVGNDHWRYAIRRAAYQAAAQPGTDYGIAKRTIVFSTDAFSERGTCGTDYAEFGLTRPADHSAVLRFLHRMGAVLAPWLKAGSAFELREPGANLRKESAVAYYSYAVPDDPDRVAERLAAWDAADYIRLVLRHDSAYFGVASEEVNARDYADDLWLVSTPRGPELRMLLRGQAGPYQIYAALMGKASWIDASAAPARRLEIFTADTTGDSALQGDLLRPGCEGCGLVIPQSPLGVPWTDSRCPRCCSDFAFRDEQLLAGLSQRLSV
jgi:radical SAM superfamily enzyme YgiQ (UPF0313 family)